MRKRLLALCIVLLSPLANAQSTLLNVSYDPTRELYQQINTAFVADWKAKTGLAVTINQSHGGSSKQARSILEGLEADVATLGIASDIDVLADSGGLLAADWQQRLPNASTPYSSTVVFVVRKGNPKGIRGWDDLVRPDVKVMTPNPKTSAGARWNFLAAWAWALKQHDGDEAKAEAFVKALYANVPMLDTGARGSTIGFVRRQLGDVLITWENEAHLVLREFASAACELVVPSYSILAQPPVAVVDKYAAKHGTTELAEAYLRFLYTPAAQEIIAKSHYRPTDAQVAAKYAATFPTLEMATIEQFGGWKVAQPKYFGDGGVFDRIVATR